MSADRRNPYITLGLPHGASLDEAQREFERRAAHVRRGTARGASLAELTWALEQIRTHAAEPATGLDTYRLPIETAALRPPTGSGLLRPAPRPSPRRSGATPPDEREVVFDAARLDASRLLLDRTATAVGRQLERIGDAPLPTVALEGSPTRRRGWAPMLAVAAVAAVLLVVALVRPGLDGNDEPTAITSDPTVATSASTAPAATTTTLPAPPGLRDLQSVDGFGVTPSEPLNGFGLVCLLIRVEGAAPLSFDRNKLALVVGGQPVALEPKVGTGRASLDPIPSGAGEAVREACFNAADWTQRQTELMYIGAAGTLTWTINDPAVGG